MQTEDEQIAQLKDWWDRNGKPLLAGGALGSALRFVIGDAMLQRFGQGFPWGTLSANFMGAFAAGYLIAALTRRK